MQIDRTYNVYLVGQISSDIQTFAWREEVETWLGSEKFKILNPCASQYAQRLLSQNSNIEEYKKKVYSNKEVPIIPHRDYNMVLLSDIGIANMNIITPEKPMIGSFFELAWYFLHPEKTVIGIAADRQKEFHCHHPFVTEAIKVWVKDNKEAVEVIKDMF
jgi:nucleoside 2-deoxyribosyltransferase